MNLDDEKLLDVLYGEESAASIDELSSRDRERLAELQLVRRMSGELTLVEPPSTLRRAILESIAQKPAAEAPEQSRNLRGGFWDRLRGLIHGPQVAMATVMLLVVSLGVWYVPRGEPEPNGSALMQPDPDGEAVATVPAPEIEGRSGDGDEESRAPGVDHARAPEKEPELRVAQIREGETGQSESQRARAETADSQLEEDDSARRRPRRQVRSARRLVPNPNAQERSDDTDRSNEAIPRRVGEASPRTLDEANAEQRPRSPPPIAAQPVPEEEAPSASRGPSNSIEPIGGDQSAYQRGIQRYEARDYRGAAEEFERVVRGPAPSASSITPSALHHLARSHRQRGACRSAIPHYELLRRFPAYRQIPQALLEAADCHRRQGRIDAARRLLLRATRYNGTEAAAARELRRLDTLEDARRAVPAADVTEAD